MQPPNTLRTLLTGLVDYAGLFPPAKLSMADAAAAFARSRQGEHEWMLGRFVCPVSRLEEFEREAGVLMPGTLGTSGYRETAGGEPWRLTVLADGDLVKDLDAIDAFNARHGADEAGRAAIDMMELKVSAAGEVDDALDEIPEDIFPFFEFPVNQDCRGLVASLAGERAGAKIRTGGLTAQAFPTPAEVVAFMTACMHAGVPFKATAGLHHPLRGSYRLTYEPNSACGGMYGFVNVFLCAAFLHAKGENSALATALLTEEDPGAFTFAQDAVRWRSHALDAAHIAAARERCALSFGSCSFDEPVEDLRKLGWL